MSDQDICISCSKEILIDPNTFTCKHTVCSCCIYKNVMHKYNSILLSDVSATEIELECLVCKKGKFQSTIKNIWELLEKSQDAKEERKICSLHNKIIESCCFKCKWEMCCDCTEIHQKIPAFKDHNLLNDFKLISFNRTCPKHNLSYECSFFCKNCDQPVCSLCVELDHNISFDTKNHKMEFIVNHYKKIESEIKSNKLPFESFKDFKQHLEKESNLILEQLNTYTTKMNDTIQCLNQSLQNFKEDFNLKVNLLQANFTTKFSILEFITKKFFEDLNSLNIEDYEKIDMISLFQKNLKKFRSKITSEYNMDQLCIEFEKKIEIEMSRKLKIQTYIGNPGQNISTLQTNQDSQNQNQI
jgi:hypothetical protein